MFFYTEVKKYDIQQRLKSVNAFLSTTYNGTVAHAVNYFPHHSYLLCQISLSHVFALFLFISFSLSQSCPCVSRWVRCASEDFFFFFFSPIGHGECLMQISPLPSCCCISPGVL